MLSLSKNEKFIVNFLGKVGCCSMAQLNYIMKKCFEIGDSQTLYMLKRLESNKYLRFTADNSYIVAEVNKNLALNMDMISCINVFCKYLDKSMSATSIIIPLDAVMMKFISQKQLFQLVHIDVEDISPILLVQEKYNHDTAINSGKPPLYSTIFIGQGGEDEDLVFEIMEKANLTMPHTLAIMNGKLDENGLEMFDKYELK